MGYYAGDHYRYRGDYYRGDYYRGDPGFFSSIGKGLSKAFRVVSGAALGFATGGPKGAIGGAVAGLAIMISVMGINLLGDGLRDVLDPRLRAGD